MAQIPNLLTYMNLNMTAHLHGDIPGHVDVAFKLIHPNLRHSQGVSPHVRSEVLGVGFVSALDVSDPCTGQDLDAAATLPHLVSNIKNEK